MNKLFFCRPFVLHAYRLVGVVVVAAGLSPAISAAQNTLVENKNERGTHVRVGAYLSGSGIIEDFHPNRLLYRPIQFPEEDVMPYPDGFLSIRYNKYQIFWGSENDGNEHIFRFSARYNYYPIEQKIYIFFGPTIWSFKKEFSYIKINCIDDIIYTIRFDEKCDGETIVTDIKTSRPDGRTITYGINTGFGVEYSLFDFIVFSHEIEFYFSACKRKDFICWGSDLRLLGLHLQLRI